MATVVKDKVFVLPTPTGQIEMAQYSIHIDPGQNDYTEVFGAPRLHRIVVPDNGGEWMAEVLAPLLQTKYDTDFATAKAAAVLPTFTSLPPTATATIDTPYSFQLTAACSGDGNSIDEFWLTDNPGWLTIDPATGLISGTPLTGDDGATLITYGVQDKWHNSVELTWTLTVS